MNNTYIRFVESGKRAYPAQGFSVPLTKRISTIENLGGRSSSFSKTIVFDGTKENNVLFGHFYDVNLEDSTFDRKALIPVQIIQDDEILFSGYLRLMNITNSTNELGQHKKINYECVVYNEVGKFFQNIRNRYLSELDFTAFNHIYNSSAVTSSFNHTWVDGYKYTLPITDDNTYDLPDLRPSIYAKQIFDKIFANSGYGYIWSSLEDDSIQFDKVLMPYVGDALKFQPSEYIDIYAKVENTTSQTFTSPSASISDGQQLFWNAENPISAGYANSYLVQAPTVIVDEGNNYSSVNSRYVMPLWANASQSFKTRVKVNLDFNLINNTGGDAIPTPPPAAVINDGSVGFGYNVMFRAVNQNNELLQSGTLNLGQVQTVYENGNPTFYILPNGTTSLGSNLDFEFIITSTNLQEGDSIRLILIGQPQEIGAGDGAGLEVRWRDGVGNLQPVSIQNQVVINNVELEYYPDTDNVSFGAEMKLNRLLPKMTQSEFINGIANLYNLYFDIDEENENTIIIKTRNEYYSEGDIVDLNKEFLKDLPQNIKFADESSSKLKTIRFKEGKSLFNEEFQNIFPGETYGQISYQLENFNLKGEDIIELPFEGCQVIKTDFGAIVLAMDGFAPKQLPTLAIDGGLLSCGPYSIYDYYQEIGGQNGVGEQNLTQYPYAGHLNHPTLATFDLGFSFPRILGYGDAVVQTQNNLFNLHWRRTFNQINKSKILEAYFDLNNVIFKNIKLNDTIQLWNSWWNILEIIDYDASSKRPTLIKLIQVDDEIGLGLNSATPGVITDDSLDNGFPFPNFPGPENPPVGGLPPIAVPVPTYPSTVNSVINASKKAFAKRKNIDLGIGNFITGKYNVVDENSNYNVINGNSNFVQTSNAYVNENNSIITGDTFSGDFLPLTGGTLTGELNLQDSIVQTTGFFNTNTSDVGQYNSIFHSFDSTLTGGPVAGPTSMSMILGGVLHSMNNPSWCMIIGGSLNSLESNGPSNNPIDSGIFVGNNNVIRAGINSVILGGQNNLIDPVTFSVNNSIIGGLDNLIEDGSNNHMLGGVENTINSDGRSITIGGQNNTNLSTRSYIIGGNSNITSGNSITSCILGGGFSTIFNSTRSSIIGGLGQQIINSSTSSIIGGAGHQIIGNSASNSIIGGQSNTIGLGGRNSIIGGQGNQISGNTASNSIIGGQDNTINSANRSVIIGGENNTINLAVRSVIIGGENLTLTQSNTVAVPFLSINDFATFTPRATSPTAVAGRVYFDSVTNKLRCYDGTVWQDLF